MLKFLSYFFIHAFCFFASILKTWKKLINFYVNQSQTNYYIITSIMYNKYLDDTIEIITKKSLA